MMKLYGIIGHPLGHSFSRTFFTEKFAAEGIDAQYLNFDLDSIDCFPQLLLQHPNLRGFNVTLPYKQAIIPYLDCLSETAETIGAVNVVKVCKGTNGIYHAGYNSDTIGFTQSLKPLLKPHHKQALVLGTGGASKAVCYSLDKLGIAWRYVSRTPRPGAFTYEMLTPEHFQQHTLVINTTPLGMSPAVDTCPNIPYQALGPQHLVYDLVYNPAKTRFLALAEARGATIKNGLEMLYLQAKASWEFWEKPYVP